MAFLALDVGNTAVKVGVWDGEAWAHVVRFPSRAAAPEAWAERLLAELGGDGVAGAGLASVAPRVGGQLAVAVALAWDVVPRRVSGPMAVPPGLAPFRTAYRTQATLGADRLAAAAAAFDAYGRPAGRPVVALDAGTAVTLDAVTAAGVHLGGAILPGPAALAKALARGTAQLPRVEFEAPPSPIGTTTDESIRSGVVLGLVDALAGLLARTEAALGAEDGPPLIVATGGWAEGLAAHLPFDAVEPHLVLDGVRLLVGGDRI